MSKKFSNQGQSNKPREQMFCGDGGQHFRARSLSMILAAAFLLAISSHHSEAGETQQSPTEIENPNQSGAEGQTQAVEKQDNKAKTRCRPRKPCPETENPQ
jgi:hypothetical protein